MKKLLSLVLCLMMLLPSFAMAEEEPITISVAPYMLGPWNEEKDVVVHWTEDYLKEKYGLNVKFDVVFIESANYFEIINTRIAGGNAPDIFQGGSAVQMQKYYEQGAIASWDVEFFKENAPHTYEFLNNGGYNGNLIDYVPMFWDYSCMDDGKMVTVAYMKEQGVMPAKSLIYRGDWLEALNVTEDQLPTTLDDFIALMYRFANEDPNGNGVKDTYGLSKSGVKAIFGAFGSSYDDPIWLEDENGNLVSTNVMEENKAALELCAKLYAEGVLDPEFVTGENHGGYWAVNHSFINGVIGVSCHASINHYRRPEILNDQGGPVTVEWNAINPDVDYVFGPWVAGPEGEYGLIIGYPVTYGAQYVYDARMNEDTEKLATIFKIMDIFTTDDEMMIRNFFGVEGEHFVYNEDGSISSKGYSYNATGTEVGIMALRGLYGAESPNSANGMYLSFNADPQYKAMLEFYANPQCGMYRQNKVTTTLPSEAEYKAELDTLREETFTNIITGVASIDTYDDYVAEYMAMGGDILTAEANEWYASTK